MARLPWWLRCTRIVRVDGQALVTVEIDKRLRRQLVYLCFLLYLLGKISGVYGHVGGAL